MTADRNKQNSSFNYVLAERAGASGDTRTSVSLNSSSTLPYILSENFNQKAAVSLEQLFCPISSESGGVFPHLESPNYSIERFNYGIIPTTGLDEPPSHDEIIDKTGDSYRRSIAFNMPMYGAGRGLSTSGTTVGGTDENDIMNFKAGPIDLRWDDTRKVWTGFDESNTNTICGYLNESITAATARHQPSSFTIKETVTGGPLGFQDGPIVSVANFDTNFALNYVSGDDIFVIAIKKYGLYMQVYVGCPT